MKTLNSELIAPCGMNCALCCSYLAYKNDLKSKGINHTYCKGCRQQNKICSCIKKKCKLINKDEIDYCYECNEYPCKAVSQLDKRYTTFYRMSEIENLNFIKEFGIKKFLKQQEKKWKCEECGELISCHNGICYSCGIDKLKNKKRRYRWED
jgi:hypothetical protein